ncbi:tRNA pseudouridine(38-40) synthase [Cyphellophora europaea CBS 101466]|uniref:tRNA pseudouridine(38-40) synthase n=1 Tax=Cyphellophora europaea (strain CBS 101466) TaxID=1220924 RepID=W2SGN8_CYPE1|nr:tRNA pseudouridine(38-40) synthase [Cyphellophora europaea CBS 101466]ETN47049.1 tRNA pseudouridine(38-40) synthase [Cyphellophora europaea CBS 101466]
MATSNGQQDSPRPSTDYSHYTPAELISRINRLETQLQATNSQLAALTTSAPPASSRKPKAKPSKPFDASRFSTRLIALKFSYMGQHYNGFEHANGTVPPKPTVEEVLWKALRKARLISPPIAEGADEDVEVEWEAARRLQRYAAAGEATVEDGAGGGKKRLELNWDGCEYSKCGRTDRGVSAFGQVVGVRVRSNAPKRVPREGDECVGGAKREAVDSVEDTNDDSAIAPPGPPASSSPRRAFDPVADELPYLSILNSILPASIRILAWAPTPPADFDARFSCKERRYKYFFTNPAFLPTPGPIGMTLADGSPSPIREGWLDIDKMREAAKKLEGTHDYRNLCKIDPSKQMSSCERRINFADVELWESGGRKLTDHKHLNATGEDAIKTLARRSGIGEFVDEGPKVYCFSVHGSAFLWHQVRCMVAVLFLVGQGLEQPRVVDQLLDVESNPKKAMYEMADDGPLVLWDCVFDSPEDGGRGKLDWVYAGDAVAMPAVTSKNDTKFGLGGLTDTLWTQWRKAKLEETVTSSLLDQALNQGDGTPLTRGGFRQPSTAQRSQKIFDGADSARVVGLYTPIAKKPKMDTLENQNEKYRNGRQARKDTKRKSALDGT